MEPTLDNDDVNSILMYCAYLRGVYSLPHRTIHEFNWFVNALVFGGEPGDHPEAYAEKDDIMERYKHHVYKPGNDKQILHYARAFLEYCKEEYKEE